MIKILIFIIIGSLYILCARYNNKHKISSIYTIIGAILLLFQLLGLFGELSNNLGTYNQSISTTNTVIIIGNIAEYIGYFLVSIVALLLVGIPCILNKRKTRLD